LFSYALEHENHRHVYNNVIGISGGKSLRRPRLTQGCSAEEEEEKEEKEEEEEEKEEKEEK